jgi:radical SAM protein with 4Fe4S-binding SPASM domain
MIYRLHPDIGLRSDIDRNIIYIKNPADAALPDFFRLIDTPSAIILALFDGSRNLEDIIKIISRLLFAENPHKKIYRDIEVFLKSELSPDLKVKDILIAANDCDERINTGPDLRTLIVDKSKLNLGDPRLRIPLRMLYIPTLACHQHCYYCYSVQSSKLPNRPLSFERLTEIFKEAKDLGIDVVDISGGEPFTYEFIFRLIELSQDLGIQLNIPTKCPLDDRQVSQLMDLGIDKMQFSIDAITPSLLDHTVGVDGYYKKMLKTFSYLAEAGIKLRINTVVTRFNIGDIKNLISFLTSCDNVYQINLSPYARSRFRHKDNYYVPQEKYSELLRDIEAFQTNFPSVKFNLSEIEPDPAQLSPNEKEKSWKKRTFCTGGRHAFVVLPDGKVTMCEELYYHPAYIIGDLSNQSIMEFWNSQAALRISYPEQSAVVDGPCEYCEEFKACHIFPGRCVRESIKVYGEQRHYFPDPRCPRAH